MDILIPLAGAGVLAFLLNAAITPIVMRVARAKGWFDVPNARKIHTDPIPRLGGVGIFLSFLVSALAATVLFPLALPGFWGGAFHPRFLIVFAGFLLIHAVGLLDDFFNLRALLKFALELVAAALVIAAGFAIPLGGLHPDGAVVLSAISWSATLFWIVGISNAMNLVDGVDGFAGGIAFFAALAMGIIAMLQGNLVTALVAVALLGSVIAFLVFNFPPARIFMGDSGSLLLGFTLSVIPLLGSPSAPPLGVCLAPLTVLTIPIIDTAAAIVRRVRRRLPIHSPDKEHIHHVLLDLGMKERTILLAIYSYCAYLGAAAVVATIVPWKSALAITVMVWIGSLAAYVGLHARATRVNRIAGQASR
jgi:UDP-GlcNAc:undecaprenyl-phosphate GlcNAc-1-phosphate transferase